MGAAVGVVSQIPVGHDIYGWIEVLAVIGVSLAAVYLLSRLLRAAVPRAVSAGGGSDSQDVSDGGVELARPGRSRAGEPRA
ncbi:hypothetical protein [uncultured Pseudokineococcus sp.]|uniref:hypothetical protein n=1 Tax=uncultured Pseudokineococcus sp. TaxID=1642928 RepID=UPI002627672F|nr:hypothetical protein [uncultured Pseudokineococcus sp.]